MAKQEGKKEKDSWSLHLIPAFAVFGLVAFSHSIRLASTENSDIMGGFIPMVVLFIAFGLIYRNLLHLWDRLEEAQTRIRTLEGKQPTETESG